MNKSLKRKQQQRAAFLNKLYEISDGDSDSLKNGAEVATQIGLEDGDEDKVRAIANYLEGEGLIRVEWLVGGFPGYVRITHRGILEIEAALGAPDNATEHFMPINILNIENMIGSNIQQGTINSQQEASTSIEAIPDIQEFLEKLSRSISEFTLNEMQNDELNAEIASAVAQTRSPHPKNSILQECLSSIRNILENTTASAAGAALVAQIPALLALL